MSQELRAGICPAGCPTWDVWGETTADGDFTPTELTTYLCPSCDELAEAFKDHEALS